MTPLQSDQVQQPTPTGRGRRQVAAWIQSASLGRKTMRLPLGSLAVLAVVVACGLFAPLLSPHDPQAISLKDARLAPFTSSAYPLGTDLLGRDMLSRLMYGARSSMTVSLIALSLSVLAGMAVGILSGYVGGWVDRAAMRVTDAVLGFPSILTAMLVVVAFGQGVQNVVLAVVLTTWPRFARMLRGEVLRYSGKEFVTFARIAGTPGRAIVRRHILPNVLNVVAVVATLTLAEVILLEASLSFLGLGFPPGAPAWGIMVAEGRQVLLQAWWVSLLPGVTITAVVIAVNFAGDWLADLLDPQRRTYPAARNSSASER